MITRAEDNLSQEPRQHVCIYFEPQLEGKAFFEKCAPSIGNTT
jgi:hypothetical protein